jgi:hypothetical protein
MFVIYDPLKIMFTDQMQAIAATPLTQGLFWQLTKETAASNAQETVMNTVELGTGLRCTCSHLLLRVPAAFRQPGVVCRVC